MLIVFFNAAEVEEQGSGAGKATVVDAAGSIWSAVRVTATVAVVQMTNHTRQPMGEKRVNWGDSFWVGAAARRGWAKGRSSKTSLAGKV